MEERWHIFFRDPWLHLVRSWTGFCVYKARVEKNNEEGAQNCRGLG
jgi:hypothetical protein